MDPSVRPGQGAARLSLRDLQGTRLISGAPVSSWAVIIPELERVILDTEGQGVKRVTSDEAYLSDGW